MSGEILAEAAIGLSLLVFVWILVLYVSYMCNNRLRTNMAGRYSAWLSGNGVDPTANNGAIIAANFFMGDDTKLVEVAPSATSGISVFGITLPSISGIPGLVPDICSNSVTFGMPLSQVSETANFPFILMNSQVPYMPSTVLSNFTIVTSHSAWPADITETYSDTLWQSAMIFFGYGAPVAGIPE
jgi:hypothetical protein